MGHSNLQFITDHVKQAYQEHLVLHQAELHEGKDSILSRKQDELLSQAVEGVQLHEVQLVDIAVNAQHTWLGGVELNIADMFFKDFSKEHNAVGIKGIVHELSHAFRKAVSTHAIGE